MALSNIYLLIISFVRWELSICLNAIKATPSQDRENQKNNVKCAKIKSKYATFLDKSTTFNVNFDILLDKSPTLLYKSVKINSKCAIFNTKHGTLNTKSQTINV